MCRYFIKGVKAIQWIPKPTGKQRRERAKLGAGAVSNKEGDEKMEREDEAGG